MSFPNYFITASVGQGGVNKREDMRIVEDLLRLNHGYHLQHHYLPLPPGECLPALLEAIFDFQKGSMPQPNGRVDLPAGPKTNINRLTYERLVRPSLIQLPQVLGRGYYSYSKYPQEIKDRQFGTPQTIRALQQVAGIFFFKMGYDEVAIPGNRPYREIGIGDISHAKGGPIRGHQEHRWGTEVDIRPLRKDGRREPVSIGDKLYDREATRILVKSLISHPNVKQILFNDPQIRGVRSEKGHHNHLHVSMKC